MKTSKKKFFITTPIYYPSGKPHMGHAYSSIIADVFARFKRLDGFNVHFVTGTDEHGLKIQRAAEQNKMQPIDFCNKISKTFEDLTTTLNLSNTDFIRTTEQRHFKSVQKLWNILEKNGDYYLGIDKTIGGNYDSYQGKLGENKGEIEEYFLQFNKPVIQKPKPIFLIAEINEKFIQGLSEFVRNIKIIKDNSLEIQI